MRSLGFHLKPLLRIFAVFALTLFLCSPSANPESASPIYWVASMLVSVKFYDKDEFRMHLLNFYSDVQKETSRRSMMGGTDTKQCYNSAGKKVLHCEVVDIAWESQIRKLILSIEESDGQVGILYQHECSASDSFTDCFKHHRQEMAGKVGTHDSTCHQQGKKCKVNDNNEFEPSPD